MLNSDIFSQAWERKEINKPLVVLVGGYAGTGKSTLAKTFSGLISHVETIPTGIFRSIAQTQTTADSSPALFCPTYDLHTIAKHGDKTIIELFDEQCQPVSQIIDAVLSFLAVEKQHLIIEGNHVVPTQVYTKADCHIIELYMYVADPEAHRSMLGGPTHSRSIDDEQFVTGRSIHDGLVEQARLSQKALFECSETDKAEQYLQDRLSEIVEISGVQG